MFVKCKDPSEILEYPAASILVRAEWVPQRSQHSGRYNWFRLKIQGPQFKQSLFSPPNSENGQKYEYYKHL